MFAPRAVKAMVVALTLAVASAVGVRAEACGASAGGIAGISGCSLAEHDEAVRKKWHVGVSGSYASTAIRFDDDLRFDQTRNVLLATVGYAGAGVALLIAERVNLYAEGVPFGEQALAAGAGFSF